jgi:hypothetical protein
LKSSELDKLEMVLKDTLNRTVEWLKFAETKNAALLTFCSAWLLAMGGIAFGGREVAAQTKVAIGCAAPFLGFAVIFAIGSLLPKLSILRLIAPTHRFNPLFYGDVTELKGGDFYAFIKARYDGNPDLYLKDIADQIEVNSRIAKAKFHRFKMGAYMAITSIIVFLGTAYLPLIFI